MDYDGRDRPLSTTSPEGDSVVIAYDAVLNPWAGNVATVTRNPKPGSGLAPLITGFTYDPAWNKPVTIVDPRGIVTGNEYDPATGSLTRSVADAGAVQLNAASRFTYDSHGLTLTRQFRGHNT